MQENILAADLDQVIDLISPHWQELHGKRIFLTGGTGFFGCWFLESFLWAVKKYQLNTELTILTRNPESFKRKYPYLIHSTLVNFQVGDIQNFTFPDKIYSYFIHAAADMDSFYNGNGIKGLETSIRGAIRVLDFAKHCQAQKFLLISSGAIYGSQPTEMAYLNEEFSGRPDDSDPQSSYGMSKYLIEHLAHTYHQRYQLDIKIARCFTFIGPYLSLNASFAISQFLKSILENKPVVVKNGQYTYRSYLYAADMVAWLWKILFCGKSCRPYNVGSNDSISILDLAKLVIEQTVPSHPISVIPTSKGQDCSAKYYVPDITRAQQELNLTPSIDLPSAIIKTLQWHRSFSCK